MSRSASLRCPGHFAADVAAAATELLGDATVDDVTEATGAPFVVALEESHAAR